jgi:guanosine-3',5'-bis(diphosphate) 3'-pyrophosphohydrolase
MFSDQVFCFTPKGELIALPRGATPVDFAYAVHSDIGDTCVGARINGRLVPLRSQLRNGDQVEILRNKEASPSPAWENFVVSGKARAAVRRVIRRQQRSQYVELGRAIVRSAVREHNIRLSNEILKRAIREVGRKTLEDFYAAVGSGDLPKSTVIGALNPDPSVRERAGQFFSRMRPRFRSSRADRDGVPIRGLVPGVAVHMAPCCHPLPGERIVGILTPGQGVTVHTIDCETLGQFNETPERWLDVSWDAVAAARDLHMGRLETVLSNTPGSLSRLTTIIAEHGANISNLKITDRSSDFFSFQVDLEVKDVRHMTGIIAALRAEPTINSVERARG